MRSNTALAGFAALSNAGRLEALQIIARSGNRGISSGRLAARLKKPQANMSNHLTVLYNAGFVRAERSGRHIIYHANKATIKDLVQFVEKRCAA